MRQIQNLADARESQGCVYCGLVPQTRDHVPSKVLLNEPFPENLPVVAACSTCNGGFSLDEQYFACLLECVRFGTCDPTSLFSEKISRILVENPALLAKLRRARKETEQGPIFDVEFERVKSVVLKLARGHAAYENSAPRPEEPTHYAIVPLHLLTDQQRAAFEQCCDGAGWPEVGSRALSRIVDGTGGWITVQPNVYRYAVSVGPVLSVRIVFAEYVAAEVIWEE